MYAGKIGLFLLAAVCSAPAYAQEAPSVAPAPAAPGASVLLGAAAPNLQGVAPGGDASTYGWARSAGQEEFAYRIFADRDEQLSRWCKTGFAPAELCARQIQPNAGAERPTAPTVVAAPAPPPAPAPAPAPAARPSPAPQSEAPQEVPVAMTQRPDPVPREITMWDGKATARLVYPDGTEEKAKVGTVLADGSTVVSIKVGEGVKVRRPSEKIEALRGRGTAQRVLIPLDGPAPGAAPGRPAPISVLPQASLLPNRPTVQR